MYFSSQPLYLRQVFEAFHSADYLAEHPAIETLDDLVDEPVQRLVPTGENEVHQGRFLLIVRDGGFMIGHTIVAGIAGICVIDIGDAPSMKPSV